MIHSCSEGAVHEQVSSLIPDTDLEGCGISKIQRKYRLNRLLMADLFEDDNERLFG